jgi:AraC family transcriptional regulator of adaptative response/methylated-DNA-[protein]-cysteine methyltransferase
VIMPQRDTRDAATPLLRYVAFETEIGRFLVSRSDRGLRSVRFGDDLNIEKALSRDTRGRRYVAVEDTIGLRRLVDEIRAYLKGTPSSFEYRLDLEGFTDFERRVLEATRKIPFGTLRSYKWVAREIGSPRATRPVGQALARNPLPVVVPCHRVVESDGNLGGYSSGGTDMKRRLIEIETGQFGLAFPGRGREVRERILFLLEPETEDDG